MVGGLGGRGGEGCNRDREREECPGAGSVWPSAEASHGASPSPSPQDSRLLLRAVLKKAKSTFDRA